MGMLAWVMMGLALWHFTIWLPDRYWGGIVGAFIGALAGAALVGFMLAGFHIPGRQKFHAAELDSAGDHRIAMAFAVAALAADGPCVIGDAGAAAVSFPEFFSTLRDITG